MSLTDLLGNLSTGGILGIVGSIGTGVLAYFQRRQEHQFALEEMKEKRETLRLQGDLVQLDNAGKLSIQTQADAGAAFTASQETAGRLSGVSRWVANLQGFTRPGLTWYFTLVLTAIVAVSVVRPDWLDDAPALVAFAVGMIVDMTGMMIAWWFGQRQIDKMTKEWSVGKTKVSSK